MRSARLVAVLVVAAAIAVAAFAGSARAGGPPTVCIGDFTGVAPGNLVVPSGDFCRLLGATVEGNVLVEPGAIGFASHGATIGGSVLSPGPIVFDVRVLFSTVGGNVLIGQTAPGTSGAICRSTIGNNVILENNAGFIDVGTGFPQDVCQNVPGGGGNHIEGNLDVDHNSGLFPIRDNTIDGSVDVDSNTGGAESLTRNTIGHTLQCEDNTPAPFSALNTAGNFVGQCQG
jgi:hypothetical protein